MHISRLTPAHAAAYRAFMLQTYADEPEGFTATVAERAPLPLAWWTARVSDEPDPAELVYGAFVDARLVGVAGLRFERRERTRHKASLFGLCMLPSFRGQGIARALVEQVLTQARSTPGTCVVQLKVMASNVPALQLYESCGFRPYGTEPYAIKMDEAFVSVVHMWRTVD
ncbi:MAG TPA: GNAT family N-acetyltransferase [Rhodothermales bacterium]|nr:GNAT family N-acetyltransferase [Rhodothermales bacterium]